MNKELKLPERVIFPRVTDIIKQFVNIPYRKSINLGIGTAVHAAAALWDKQILEWKSLDDRIIPQVTAWVDFCNTENYKPLLIEQGIFIYLPESLMVAKGTCDRICMLDDIPTVLDLKCTDSIAPTVGIQTSMYAILYNYCNVLMEDQELPENIQQRAVVYLRKNGKYKLKILNKHTDMEAASSMIYLYNYLLSNKLIKENERN